MQQILINDARVTTFLESIGRNSRNSKRTYGTGLAHFAEFLKSKNQKPDTIISSLVKGKVNVYELLDQFVSYLTKQNIAAVTSINLYMAAVRSYLEFQDIDIVPSKFRRRVKMPKSYADPEEPLTLSDIRDLLEFCNNARLTCYLLLLASSGLRPMEAASLRIKDVDFSTSPTRINIRKEITKTKRGRVVYCSDEATIHLQKLLKFRKNEMQPDSLIFSIQKRSKVPDTIYYKMLHQFEKLQKIADKDQRKENSKRHKITLHSFRRTAFSIINENTNSEFANWFLGHNHSVYWTHKEQERREIYRSKCMPFLTIYQETRDNTIETTLKEKDKAIQQLKRADAEKNVQIAELMQFKKQMQAMLREPEKLIGMLQEGPAHDPDLQKQKQRK
ncbi:MAG: tyrosine-type recombinase/integrase [Nitrososphaeraceae archaeon]|nr:tyrosine-type recombinase/integrase [Nitrososphaeraceae archaeon]